MSYQDAAALQGAVYDLLAGDAALAALLGGAIYDAVPPGDAPETFVSLGEEEVRDASDATSEGAEHRFTVSVHSTASGFLGAKEVAGRVAALLVGADLALEAGHLVGIGFLKARARRTENGDARRIDLTFRARIDL
ncbi:DUF3168 domain-containing protein [Acidimangrovimonas sediminis]|uniref:DUF3168 domain-containing protein n=1 Tax=Acidimangrovimonas sediminis TaxID=2056283 RepID=UPI000C809F96|nr:DUF3168 domain-containing protein [Acidimangrovimonas sediminis]